MKGEKNTTEAVAPGAEWLSVAGAQAVFSMSRSTIYALIADRSIKSVNLRRPGKVIGKRLIHAQSVRDYLGSLES